MQMALKLSEVDVGGRGTAFPEVSHHQQASTPLPPLTEEAAGSDSCEDKDGDEVEQQLESLNSATPSGIGGAGAGYDDQATREGGPRAHTDTTEPKSHGVGWVEEVAVCEAADDGTAESDADGLGSELAQAIRISRMEAEQEGVGATAPGGNGGAEQETEEAMMARVIAESIREQERFEKRRVESERLELEQVSGKLRRFGEVSMGCFATVP